MRHQAGKVSLGGKQVKPILPLAGEERQSGQSLHKVRSSEHLSHGGRMGCRGVPEGSFKTKVTELTLGAGNAEA